LEFYIWISLMKKFALLLLFALLSIWSASADRSDGLFCLVQKDNVTISLKKTDGYHTCNETIASLNQLLVQTEVDLNKIQYYIDKRLNLWYRVWLRNEKLQLQQQLRTAKNQIVESMKAFEGNLIKKYVQYFVIRITPYKISLQKSLVKIDDLTARGYATIDLRAYGLLLKAQVAIIDSLNEATTMKELTDLLKKYVYFKKEISWRYE